MAAPRKNVQRNVDRMIFGPMTALWSLASKIKTIRRDTTLQEFLFERITSCAAQGITEDQYPSGRNCPQKAAPYIDYRRIELGKRV